MDLTISIVTWNEKDYLKQCLKSIFEGTRDLQFEVIVIDNASTDGTVEMVKNEFPRVVLIKNSRNLGFAKANNQAIRLAKGEYVVILNQDTVILDNAFKKMISFLNKHKDVGALGCKIYTSLAKTDIQISAFTRFPTPTIMFVNTLLNGKLRKLFPGSKFLNKLTDRYSINYNNYHQKQEVQHLVGVIIMTRKYVIEDVGLLDEQFFMYFEETDWCYRMRKKGWRIYYTPDAEIVHFYDPTRSTRGDQSKIRQESHLKYLKKHHSIFSFCFFKVVYTFLSIKHNFNSYAF
jgi:hypothetical protein